jgi:N-acetyl-anhydromuramyl-L-alanine amidase AmpD
MKHIDLIVLHCSDSPDEHDVTAADIHEWHREKGWDGIAYHYVVERDGNIALGRPVYWQGAHVRGHNSDSLGICVVGRDRFTPEQYKSLHYLFRRLNMEHNNPKWLGHRELDQYKTCPNDELMGWLEGVRK